MNVNSVGGGMWSADKPARFDDGLLDLFRQRNYFGNLKRGRKFVTAKHSRVSFCVPPDLPGVHVQSDGEARYLFSPSGGKGELDMRRVMQIPVAIGPEFFGLEGTRDPMAVEGSMKWVEAQDCAPPMVDAAWLPATCSQHVEHCKAICQMYSFGGFMLRHGKAQFWQDSATQLKVSLEQSQDATTFILEGESCFGFLGAWKEAQEFRTRFEAWVAGDLIAEMNATEAEVRQVEMRASLYARGICARSQRVHMHFGMTAKSSRCCQCAKTTRNGGCRGCRRVFCSRCFEEHRGTAPNITWRYEDVRVAALRYSEPLSIDGAIDQMSDLELSSSVRPIHLKIWVKNEISEEHILSNPEGARSFLEELREEEESISRSGSNSDLDEAAASCGLSRQNSAPSEDGAASSDGHLEDAVAGTSDDIVIEWIES
jgi:hypothetical protein